MEYLASKHSWLDTERGRFEILPKGPKSITDIDENF